MSATERGVIPLQTRLRYTTMVVLPEGEDILDVLCGDRDFWVISAMHWATVSFGPTVTTWVVMLARTGVSREALPLRMILRA